MRHSIWKLTAVVGISGLGFLVILQVQKGLHDAGTVQAAELEPDAAKGPTGGTKAASKPSTPGKVRLKLEPPETAAPKAASAGLDFRQEIPGREPPPASLTRTAEVELRPIPQRESAPAAATAAADLREGDPAAEPLPVIVPAGHEEPSKAPEAEATAPPAEPAADFSDFGPNPFGPDPFGDAAPLTPDPAAAGLEEPAAAPAEQPSPSDLLDGDDPFADAPSDAADATSPEASEPTPPASEPESPFAVPPAEGPSVPVDGGEPPAETPPAAVPAADDPFADAPATEPAPAAEPAPAGEPATGDPFGEPTTDDPFGDVPASDPFPAADPGDDPFGDAAPPAEPAEPPAAAPQEPAAAEPSPVPAEEPTPGPGTEADDPFPASPDEPATESPFGDPAAEPTPLPEASTPGEEHPRLLPTDGEEDMRGVGTVTPDAPRGSQRAELSVEKKAPEQAVLGQPLVYEIVVTNVGDSPAHEVTVSDVIPKGTELQGSIPRAEMAGKMLVWRLETLAPGKSKSIKVKVLPIEAGPVGSVATVTFVSEIAAETKVVAPHLTLKVDAPEQVALGQPVDFRFEIANEGTAPAEKVLLRDLLPEGFKHSDGNDLEYEVGTLPPGKAEAVTLRVAAVKPGSYTNKAVVTAAGGLKTEAAAAVEIADRRVSVTRRGPARRYVGRPAMYHNVVRNASDRPVRGVKVVEQVPPGMEFVNASHGGQFDPDQRTVAWQVASLQPGQEQTLQVVLTAAAEGVQDSVVRVEETSGGTVELASSTAVQGVPSLAPTMQGPDRPVAVGERAAFRIRVRNRGNADATGVAVSLALPSQLKLVETRGGTAQADASGAAVVRVEAPVPAGGEQVIDFILEGTAPGTARFRAEVSASHMAKPLVKDEELTVLAPGP